MADSDNTLIDNLLLGLTQLSGWEAIGVLLAFAYLVLAIRENIWCWAVAAVSEIIFLFVMIEAKLYMESVLRVFYLGMAAYGWYSWTHGKQGRDLPVQIWPLQRHLITIAAISLLVLVSGYLLTTYTDAALPYWDSFTTWAAMITTWMVARKVLENWYYWFVIDAVSVWLYIERGLALLGLLYVVYLFMIVAGFWKWRESYLRSTTNETVAV